MSLSWQFPTLDAVEEALRHPFARETGRDVASPIVNAMSLQGNPVWLVDDPADRWRLGSAWIKQERVDAIDDRTRERSLRRIGSPDARAGDVPTTARIRRVLTMAESESLPGAPERERWLTGGNSPERGAVSVAQTTKCPVLWLSE